MNPMIGRAPMVLAVLLDKQSGGASTLVGLAVFVGLADLLDKESLWD